VEGFWDIPLQFHQSQSDFNSSTSRGLRLTRGTFRYDLDCRLHFSSWSSSHRPWGLNWFSDQLLWLSLLISGLNGYELLLVPWRLAPYMCTLIIWHPLRILFFKLFRTRMGLANLFWQRVPKLQIISGEYFTCGNFNFNSTMFQITAVTF
jgi:hypothetical protein